MAEEGSLEEGLVRAAPKKKSAARKPSVKRPVIKIETEKASPFSYLSIPPEPTLASMIDVTPKQTPSPVTAPALGQLGTNVPIKPIGIQGERSISIEPDFGAVENDSQTNDWPPMVKKEDADLSVPPSVLLQGKRLPKKEFEDILDEPDEDYEIDRDDLRPRVRTGLYRKIAIGFVALAVIVGVLVMYVVYARATVTVFPRRAAVTTERVLPITTNPQEGVEVAGKLFEVTVAGERTGAPSEATITDGIATGSVILINDSSEDQTLIPTTRLLTPEGVLFRIKNRVNVPAKGSLKTEAYADKAGVAGDIGPSIFTIPGLTPALQELIYAKSEVAMSGGKVSTGVISQVDIDKAEKGLRDELYAQAKEELEKKLELDWTGIIFEIEDVSRSQSAAAGQTANGVTIRLTVKVRMTVYDRDQAVKVAREDLQRGLTSGRVLAGVNIDASEFTIEDADVSAGTASLRVILRGDSLVSLESPVFDTSKLRSLNMDGVRTYFEGIEGVDKVDIVFRPFWIKRMPVLVDNIEFVIAK